MRRIALGLLGCLMLAATGCCCNHNLCGMSSCDPCGSSCTSGGLFGSGCDSCGSMDCCGSIGCGTEVGYSPSCAAPSCAAPAYSAMPTNCPECAAPAPTTYRGAYLSPQIHTSQAAPPVMHAPVTYDTSWQTTPHSTASTLNEPAALPAVPAY